MWRVIIIFLAFFAASVLSRTYAASPGEEKIFEDKLIAHTNPIYTHLLPNAKANLIIKDQFDQWIGKQVRVKVRYMNKTQFKVLFIELIHVEKPDENGGNIDEALSSFKGVLSLSPVEGRDYRVTGASGNLFIDFSAPTNFNNLLGKAVELTYTGTQSNPVFKKLSEIQRRE